MIFMGYALYKGIQADFREPLDRQEGEIAAEQPAGQLTPNLGRYPNRSHLQNPREYLRGFPFL